jgi:two-component system nitrogen regulation sensor histidine kinase GlnL
VKLWREIVENLPDAVIVLSDAMELIAINPAAETLLGMSGGNPAKVAELMAHNPWLKRMVRVALDSGRSVGDGADRLAMRGHSPAVATEVCPLLSDQGETRGAILMFHELARRKEAEAALAASTEELGLSTAGLAHEVRNPLTAIRGAAELLAAMLRGNRRAEQYCDLILDGVSRISHLVEQVMAAGTPQGLRREPLNVHRLLHQALRMTGLLPVPLPGINVEQRFDPSLPDALGDAQALERVFVNLIQNAIDAMHGHGTVMLRTRMVTDFHVTSEGRHKRFLEVEIADNGRGMNAAEFGRLFTPFFTTKPKGAGLGLVLSQRIVALHGGKLWAERGSVLAARHGEGNNHRAGETEVAAVDLEERIAGMTMHLLLPVASGDKDDGEAAR